MADRARLEKIIDNMHFQIQKVIYKGRFGQGTERALHGGESAADVLQDAVLALLEYDPSTLRATWESLSVGIAKNKALVALRRATRGRRAANADPGAADDVMVVALDDIDPRDEDNDHDPERSFERTQQQLVLLRLARELLSDRERVVFFGLHFEGRTRVAVAVEVGLTPQAVGQMYVKILKKLHAAACRDPWFPTDHGTPDGRTK